MTKQDYELIAAALKEAYETTDEPTGVGSAAFAIADALAKDNPRFNREKFYQAWAY